MEEFSKYLIADSKEYFWANYLIKGFVYQVVDNSSYGSEYSITQIGVKDNGWYDQSIPYKVHKDQVNLEEVIEYLDQVSSGRKTYKRFL
ncbi:MAG: hypothetical protein ACHQ1D_01580 [Nitrososphaerales archaeon]